MSAEDQEQTKRELAQLVDMRNDLVHHFLERFDIASEDGCISGAAHLHNCYEEIDLHCQRLKTWALGQEELRRQVVSFMDTAAFKDLVLDGISPDGSVTWAASGIVACLREAEAVCNIAGWTLLDTAIGFISSRYKEQTPGRYGCETWRDVLKTAGTFEWRTKPGDIGKRGEVWYRGIDEQTDADASIRHG